MSDLIPTHGWVCCYCREPVELVRPGAWWRHEGAQGDCEYRLMDDAYNPEHDYFYQRDEEDE